MKTAFVCDSGTGKSSAELEAEGCYSVPLQIGYQEIWHRDYETITPEEVIGLMRQGLHLTTSLATLGDIEALLIRLKQLGYTRIVALMITGELSGMENAVRLMAEQLEIDFVSFDCCVTACLQEYLLLEAKTCYESGWEIPEIMKRLAKIRKSANTLLIPDNLHYLQLSGRLTAMAARLGGFLRIKPILAINEQTKGKVDSVAKARTMNRAIEIVLDTMKNDIPDRGRNFRIHVAHADNGSQALLLSDQIHQCFESAEIMIVELASAVAVHTGPGCLGVQYYSIA